MAPATKEGISIARQGGCMIFAAKGGIYTGAPKGAHFASAAVLYTSRGRSPQPVREASAGPRQNPWRPGPEARRRHQPSRRSRVNLREYWKAPPRSRSRSRPRHSRLNPARRRRALLLFPSKTTTLKTENTERKCILWIRPVWRQGSSPIRPL